MSLKQFTIAILPFVFLAVLPLSAGISFVQQSYATSNPSGSSLRVAYPTAQTTGNLNIVVVGWNDTSSVVSSITDSKGNAYARAIGPTAGPALTQSIYYAKNVAGGNNTVTVTFNRAAAYPDVRVLEYNGADTANPLDVTAAAAGTGLSANSGLASTTSLNELILGAGMTFDVYNAAGSGFMKRVITNFGDIAEDATVVSMGSYSATASLRVSAPWVMQMATFRGQSSSNPAFTVSGISPGSGSASGGTRVTITGMGVTTGAAVTFGGRAATNVTVTNSNTITATTPAYPAGTVDVVVANGNGQGGTLTHGFTYTGATSAAINFVQGNNKTSAAASSLAAAYPLAQTVGNLNIVSVMWGDTSRAVSSVTDSKGNGYTLAVGPTKATGLTSAIYYAKNIANGSNTVTVTFNGTASYPNVNVLEYSGLDTTSPLDVSAAAIGSGTTANSGSATTTSANELIIGAGNPSSVFNSAGSGFTSRMINAYGGISEDKIVTSPGSYDATATLTSGAWVMQMAAFRAGVGAPGSTHSVSMSWNASPSTNIAYYKVYHGGPYTLLGANIKATAYTDSTVQSGATYYYVTTTISAAGLESIFSNQLKCLIPTP